MDERILYILLVAAMIYLAYRQMKVRMRVYRCIPDRDFPRQWREILEQRVPFYQKLSPGRKNDFEYKVHVFLLNVRIIGVGTEATDLDRILVAAGGVIPIFGFPDWHYLHLHEVQIYPEKFAIPGTDVMANGLVG